MTQHDRADDEYMGFVGVSTGGSSINQVFPAWAAALDLPTHRLVGHDIAPGAEPAEFRRVIEQIRDDKQHRGALVTTHKMSVFTHARDLFDEVDELASLFGEISSVAKRGDRLVGSAKDPITVRMALEDFLSADHFARTGGAALVLGSGGSGAALSHQLGHRADRPCEIICTARRDDSLDHLRALHEASGIDTSAVRYVIAADPADSDALVAALPAGSLIANATGMGKDRPGSPLSDAVRFPRAGVVWEFNYRGSLEFLHQARAQQAELAHVEDGWRYFVHGWSQVIADVFAVDMPPATVDELADIAARVRS